MKNAITTLLPPDYPWADRLDYLPSTGSTNDVVKTLARRGAPHGTAILAGHQTGGHGRLGRSFHSPEGMGIYLSTLLRPDCAPTELMHLTCAAAVAVCDAVESAAGFRPGIKWTNDLVCGHRKLGGILTELGFSPTGRVDWCIVGIGINCHQKEPDFPAELRNMAGSLDMVTGRQTDPARLAAAMLDALHRMDTRLLTEKEAILDAYRAACVTLGKEISVVRGDDIRHGTALSVDNEGALVVSYPDGSLEAVNAGEVSIRGMYGYV